jgi:DNA repair exonuclease SbcCD ATPase subunit
MAPGTLNKKDNKGRKVDPPKGISKSGIQKADSSGPSKEKSKEKKKEVQENIRQAKLDRDASQSQIEKQKKKLEELAKSYNDGEHPEHKEAHDALENEIRNLNAILEEKQNEVKKLEEDLNQMDGVEQTDPSPSTSGTSSNPNPADSTSGNEVRSWPSFH